MGTFSSSLPPCGGVKRCVAGFGGGASGSLTALPAPHQIRQSGFDSPTRGEWFGLISRILLLVSCFLIPDSTSAAQVSSGTGFFISKSGYILTNQHVVENCNEIRVRGAVQPMEARLVKADADVDLALLKVKASPPRVAYLREQNGYPLRKGDAVMVIGYPLRHGVTGKYKIVNSKIIGLEGPLGEDKWVQFEDAAEKGNSGGPLLDASGNVIGVVVGKTETLRTNISTGEQEMIGRSDIAINLPYLWGFLDGTGVQTTTMTSALQHGSNYLERTARESLVNVHCIH